MEHSIPVNEQPLDMIDMSLREHLLAARAATQVAQAQHAQDQVNGLLGLHSGNPASPQADNLDPMIADSAYAIGQVDDRGDMEELGAMCVIGPDGKRRNNRELSSSKRAAQNRAAQRAFRQRKEGHIKKLEEQVRSFAALEESYKRVQAENYQLRDYVIGLQSRLIESQGSYPQPPPSINLHDHRSQHEQLQHHHLSAPEANMGNSLPSDAGASYDGLEASGLLGEDAVSQLHAAAAAAQVSGGRYVNEREQDDGGENLFVPSQGAYATSDPPSLADGAQTQAREDFRLEVRPRTGEVPGQVSSDENVRGAQRGCTAKTENKRNR